MSELERKIKAHGKSLGFDIVGITSAAPFLHAERAAEERIRRGLMDGRPADPAQEANAGMLQDIELALADCWDAARSG